MQFHPFPMCPLIWRVVRAPPVIFQPAASISVCLPVRQPSVTVESPVLSCENGLCQVWMIGRSISVFIFWHMSVCWVVSLVWLSTPVLSHIYCSNSNTNGLCSLFNFLQLLPIRYLSVRVPKKKKKCSRGSVPHPVIWNSLLFSVRHAPTFAAFRSRLKTHLFSAS